MSSFHFIMGQWNVACSMCGKERKSGDMVKNWQGQWRCPEHNEERHPQDFVREIAKESVPDFVQNPEDVDLETCTPDSISALPGHGIAGCVIAGFVYPTVLDQIADELDNPLICTMEGGVSVGGLAVSGCWVAGRATIFG